ncbi:hypothetical protein H8959_017981 [Pygathrix nigripes]
MLRSTGFFRAIDCPYWSGAPGGPCRRPYCHFRHRGARVPGAPGDGGEAPPAAGLGYDPYNPELPKPPSQRENGTLGLGEEPRPDVLELELVNQAIEAVRSEVELEQRRYRELLETAREHRAAEAPALAPCGPNASPTVGLDEDTFPLAFDYSPSSHGLLSPDTGYQPTPLATPAESGSKYLLASLDRGQGRGGGGGGALEYVPKAVSQPRRHSRPVPSGKYVVDNSRPPTDLEYDPLSNYSARHLSRASSRDERAAKRPRGPRSSEPHTPAPKKPCDPFSSCDARFSDSEDEATTATGSEPTTASTPKARADPESKATGQPPSKEGLEAEGGGLRETKETAVQCDVGDFQPPPAKPGSPAQVQASQDGGCPKEGKPKKKKSGTPPAPSCKDGTQRKDKTKDKGRGRPAEKPRVDKKGPQASSPRRKAERPEGTKKKPSSATPVASSGKGRPDGPARRPSPTSGDSRPVASRGPPRPLQLPDRKSTKAPSGKLVERKARSLDEGASQDAPKLKKRALSHADLFGDESEDEAAGPGVPSVWPPALPSLSSDSDSDSDSSLGFPEARGPPKRLKASPPPSPAPSSSSSSSSSVGVDVDYSALEKEVDFDSDPMEECLRIFNESTSVKVEDRGRLARQCAALLHSWASSGPLGLLAQCLHIGHQGELAPHRLSPSAQPAQLARPGASLSQCAFTLRPGVSKPGPWAHRRGSLGRLQNVGHLPAAPPPQLHPHTAQGLVALIPQLLCLGAGLCRSPLARAIAHSAGAGVRAGTAAPGDLPQTACCAVCGLGQLSSSEPQCPL